MARHLNRFLGLWMSVLAAILLAALSASPANAATCSKAATQGAAPASWQTYCWLDLVDYNDAAARSTGGQAFSFALSDGSTLNFRLRTTSTASTGATARTAPSWSGAAVGNSSFIGIPGRPVLYMNNSGSTVTFSFSNISISPPPGVASVTNYAFVVGDAESTDGQEFLQYTTDGSAWTTLDAVPPISGSQMPAVTGAGTATYRNSGNGQTGRLGAYIAGTNAPTTVTAQMRGSGLQGLMFAVRFASIQLNKSIGGTRIDPTDQFTFTIGGASSSAIFASGTTSGTGNGPFTAASLATASGIPLRLRESMTGGSASTLPQYRSVLTCVNDTAGSTTVMPSGLVTSDYNFGSLRFGDAVRCTFVNTPYPHLSLRKALGAGGRIFNTDQFRLRVRDIANSNNVANVVTTGTGSSFGVDTTGLVQVTAGTQYQINEAGAGTTDLARYTSGMICTNANPGSATALPTGNQSINITPALGDVITCVVTNTRGAVDAVILVAKMSEVISDPTGSANPKAIPGAIVEYRITVTNEGDSAVDADSLVMTDIVPLEMTYQTAFTPALAEGATPSGLTAFNAATMVGYSNQTGGTPPYTYSPSGPLDSSVTAIRIAPQGTMAASNGTDHPSFTIRYRMLIE